MNAKIWVLCGTCHFAPTFNGTVPPIYEESETEVLGVPATAKNKELDPDIGRVGNKMPRDQVPFYMHSFKTVTVRNVAMTAPYMHNGAFNTLEEVMDFYNDVDDESQNPNIESEKRADKLNQLAIPDDKVASIIAFIKTLNDEDFDKEIPNEVPSNLNPGGNID